MLVPICNGCRNRTPVEEVSVQQSGLSIESDPASQLVIASDDWPSWRGGAGQGIASDRTLPTTWSSSQSVAWQTSIPGRGHSAPIVVGDTVYLASADDQEQQQMVLAYDRTTGNEKWRQVVHSGSFPSKRQVHNKATNANSTLACDGERVFIAFLNNQKITASALDLGGEIIWQTVLGSFESRFGYAPSPVLYKSAVIFAADNEGGGYLTALDRQSGEIVWRVKRPEISTYSSPVIATLGGKGQLVISGCDQMVSYDPTTGDQNWATECISDATCGTAVWTDDKVFASGGYPDTETVCLDAEGERIWSNRTKVYEPSLLVVDQSLFGVTDDGIAYSWNAEDGKMNWRKRLGGSFSASPVLCNGMIYVPDLAGNTYVFEASAESYEQVAKNKIGDDSYASPAIAGNQLFLRVGFGKEKDRREKLVCIASGEEI